METERLVAGGPPGEVGHDYGRRPPQELTGSNYQALATGHAHLLGTKPHARRAPTRHRTGSSSSSDEEMIDITAKPSEQQSRASGDAMATCRVQGGTNDAGKYTNPLYAQPFGDSSFESLEAENTQLTERLTVTLKLQLCTA
ncbi:hypothetical protein HPB52_010209 [Rhipicephalus sanguineus]|uniref:Uncharacterized protein n=1 Tax=Rhipicephalus sanguineus TaxID=34632 RepID=A0A9D4T3L3_RHISA|nr:hypothetical protein HPB52_010209 [Rhipicephalus sanguineus]